MEIEARAYLATLTQLCTATWDGNVISKETRDALIADGLAVRVNGWTVVTERGLRVAIDAGALHA